MEIIKKFKVALFAKAKTGTDWIRMAKSTALDITMNGTVNTYDYIADEAPTDELDSYKPSLDQDLQAIKGSPDYDFVFPFYFNRLTGSDAHIDVMIVYMAEPTTEGGSSFKAFQQDATLNITDYNAVDKKINFNIAMNGTQTLGSATMTAGVPTFTAD